MPWLLVVVGVRQGSGAAGYGVGWRCAPGRGRRWVGAPPDRRTERLSYAAIVALESCWSVAAVVHGPRCSSGPPDNPAHAEFPGFAPRRRPRQPRICELPRRAPPTPATYPNTCPGTAREIARAGAVPGQVWGNRSPPCRRARRPERSLGMSKPACFPRVATGYRPISRRHGSPPEGGAHVRCQEVFRAALEHANGTTPLVTPGREARTCDRGAGPLHGRLGPQDDPRQDMPRQERETR